MEANLFLDKILLYSSKNEIKIQEIYKTIFNLTGLTTTDFFITKNGKSVNSEDSKALNGNIYVNLRTLGGKGGFGSMLRAIGAQIEKTTNREACRDLSGRRLRDINEEKRLKSWLEKQKDREAEALERKKKKVEKLMSVPKHEFKDAKYEAARSELTEKVSEAVEEGFKKATAASTSSIAGIKRKATDSTKFNAKKPALWIGDDISSSSDTDDSSDDETNSSKVETSSSEPEK